MHYFTSKEALLGCLQFVVPRYASGQLWGLDVVADVWFVGVSNVSVGT
jgi:hypothetical protein